MLINWFTTIAQVINFVILVALLKRFLYKPIIRAMDEREAGIASRISEADRIGKEAEQEAEAYRQKMQELEDKRQELLGKIEQEIEEHRKELRGQVHQEIEELRKRWYESVQREKNALLLDIRQRICQQVIDIGRRAFKDLGSLDLERQMVEAFLERLRDLPAEERRKLAASGLSEEKVVVTSAFDIPEDMRQRIMQILKTQIAEVITARFATSPALIAGIELKTRGYKVAWSLENYLETLEDNLAAAFPEEAAPMTGKV